MKREFKLSLTVAILATLVFISGCVLIPGQTAVPQDVDATPVSPPPSPPIQSSPMLFLDVPERIEVGSMVEVPLTLVSNVDISEISVELLFPILYLQVTDDDATADGVQARPGALPESALVETNSYADGVLRYKVSGIGAGDAVSRTLLIVKVAAISPSDEIVTIEFAQLSVLGVDGAALPVAAQPALLEVISPGSEPSPTAMVSDPTPTPDAASPTPAATPVATPTPMPVLPSATPVSVVVAPDVGIYYRIQPGQTLYRLSVIFGSTPEAIAAANGIADVTNVPIGTLIRIPVQPPVGQAAYFVAPKDNLYRISLAFGVTVEELAALNNIAPPYAIQAGQWIVIKP